MKNHQSLLSIGSLFIALTASTFLFGQSSTYDQVYAIFQAKCVTCHNSSANSGQLNLNGTPAAVYKSIVGKSPVNVVAKGKGDKLIDPGYSHRSFLLRKCNSNLDEDNGLTAGEGGIMPVSPNPPLTKPEIELIRQWVYQGAPETGNVVDTSVINAYYSGKGIDGISKPLPIPKPSEGFQIHLGKTFVGKGMETEFFIKYHPKLANDVEIYKLEIAAVPQTHHFVIYKFFAGADKNFKEGLRDTGISSHGSADIAVVFSPKTKSIVLPPGTAYLWEKTDVLDLNYHLYNMNKDSVLGVDLYLNVYTQPKGTAQSIMYTKYFAKVDFSIPQDLTNTYTFRGEEYDSSLTKMWNVWMLYTHTHKYGKDYDIYLRKPDGSTGLQVYEGFYDFEYTFNQGYYATGVEAAQRTIYPFLEVDPRNGFIHEAVFQNTHGPDPVGFGLTSNDEMMVMIMQYCYGAPLVGIRENSLVNTIDLKTYPNPFSGLCKISYHLKEKSKVLIELYSILGEKITVMADEEQESKTHYYFLNTPGQRFSPGIYFLKISVNGQQHSQKLIQF